MIVVPLGSMKQPSPPKSQIGKTNRDRLLTVVCSSEHQDDLYVVSARDMSKNERKIYYEHAKTNKTI